MDPTDRAFEDNPRRPGAEDVVEGDTEGVGVLRVGVDGRESVLTVGEFMLELGVEGLEFCNGLVVAVAGDGRVLEGVDPLDGVVRVDVVEGVDGLADVDERLVGVDGLM